MQIKREMENNMKKEKVIVVYFKSNKNIKKELTIL